MSRARGVAAPPTADTRSVTAGRFARVDPAWFGVALVLASRFAMARIVPIASEDAFITFRFARSLAEGFGATWQPGERVMGFTSLPWTLWMALGLRLGADPMMWSRVSATLLACVTVASTARLLERHASRVAAWAFVVAFGVWPYLAALTTSGMEMDLVLAGLAAAMLLIDRGSPLAGPVLGLFALTRPESLVAAAVLAVVARPRDRVVALAIVAATAVALAVYYGSPLPNSMLAKAGVYGTPGPMSGKVWWEWLFPADLRHAPNASEPIQLWAMRILLAPAFAAGLWTWRRRRVVALPLAGMVVWLGYSLLGVTYFFWYFALPAYATLVLAAVGLERVTRGPWIGVAATLYLLGSWTIFPISAYRGRAENEYRLFGTIGLQLARGAHPGDLLFAEPIGFIGWTNPGLRIMDETGLVSPEVWRRRRQGPGWYADLVDRRRPDWLLTRAGFFESGASYAGLGAPFRDADEARRIAGGYHVAANAGADPAHPELILYARDRGAR